MAISSSIISSFSSPNSKGMISGAKNFISSKKSNIGSVINNISSPVTSNFLEVFGSSKTEKILSANVKSLRNTLLETFDISRVLVTAIKEISDALKNLSLGGVGGINPAQAALVGGGVVAGTGAGVLGLNKVRKNIFNRATKEVAEEVTEKTVSKVGPKVVKKVASKTGLVPKLMNFAKKNKWLAPIAIGAGLLGLGGSSEASEQPIQTNFVGEFNSVVDKFAGAVASLGRKKKVITTAVKEEKKKKHWSEVAPGSEEEKHMIKEGVKSINEGNEQHLKQNAGDYYEFKIPEYIKNDAGEWVPKEPVIQVKPNNISSTIKNLKTKNNLQPKISILPLGGSPPPSPTGSNQQKNMTVPTSAGVGPDLAFLSSSKSDSLATLESKMIYNIVE